MIDMRKRSGKKIKDVCFSLDTTPNVLYRLGCGKNNFDATKLIQYVKAVNSSLAVRINDDTIYLNTHEDLCSVIVTLRNAVGLSQRDLAEKISKTFVTVAYIETQKKAVMVDTLVDVCNVCGAEIIIEQDK